MELRSDAYKITVHARRPIPIRVDTIGPWLECLTNLVWVAAVINSALVYLFNPASPTAGDRQTLVLWAMLAALSASHGFMIMRSAIGYVIDRVCWRGSLEQIASESIEKQVKDVCLQTLNSGPRVAVEESSKSESDGVDEFWSFDEGMEEIQKALKES